MKKLSLWAGHHAHLAVSLVIVLEVSNGFNGFLSGANLLCNAPIKILYASMLTLIGLTFHIQIYAAKAGSGREYWLNRQWIFMAFLNNFLLFALLGGIWDQRLQQPAPADRVFGNHRSEVVRYAPADSVRRADQSVPAISRPVDDQPKRQRGIYILLGIAGIIVAYFVTGLACSILCAGYGFLALLVFYLGLGGLAGSVYFFSRAGQKVTKRRDMSPDERRRDSRRFWVSWAVLVGIFSVILLATAVR